MKRTTKYRLMSGVLASAIIISNIKQFCLEALATTIEQPEKNTHSLQINNNQEETLEEFLNGLDNNQTKKLYKQLYELYDFEAFKTRSIIPQYFQTIYGNKFSCGTIQSAGCGISSLAMVSSYLFDETITPDMMAIYDNGPSPASAFEKAIRRLNLNCEIHRGQAAADNLDAALESGHPVIALVGKSSIFTNAGHFIVIASKTPDGKYIVNDPNIENYYKKDMIDGFNNGFTREQITKGLNGIYIFDTKKDFIDQRDTTLKKYTSKKPTTSKLELDENHTPKNDIVATTQISEIKELSDTTTPIIEGTTLTVLAETTDEQYLVKYNNIIGYIPKSHTTSLLESAQELYPELQLTELKVKNIAYLERKSDIRCGNSIEFDSIYSIEKYETVRILGEYDNWYFVLTNENVLGFVLKNHTKLLKDNNVVIDNSENKVLYYSNGELSYTIPTDTSCYIIRPKNGLYNIMGKKSNLVLFDPNTGWHNVLNRNSSSAIYNSIEIGDSVLVHR